MSAQEDNKLELCIFESQKSILAQCTIPMYKDTILKISGPRLQLHQTVPSGGGQDLQPIPDSEEVQQSCRIIKTTQNDGNHNGDAQLEVLSSIKHLSKDSDNPNFQNKIQSKGSFDIKFSSELDEGPKVIPQPNEPTINCKICCSDYTEDKFMKRLHCPHAFCQQCIQEYLKDCVKRAHVLEIRCPSLGCGQTFSEDVIREVLDQAWFEKYQKFYRKEKISLNKNVRWCPKPDCDEYVEGKGQNKLVCKCGQEICFECGNAYHQGLSCSDAQDQLYLQARKDHLIYDCPNCRSPIQKKSGCNHMTCYKCHHQFCWLCRGDYNSYHYVVFNIFGCVLPGGQGMSMEPFKQPMLWRTLMVIPKLILTILLIVAFLIFLPLALMYIVLKGPYFLVKKTCNFKLSRYSGCQYFGLSMLFLLLGMAFFPITLTIYIILSPCVLIGWLIDTC